MDKTNLKKRERNNKKNTEANKAKKEKNKKNKDDEEKEENSNDSKSEEDSDSDEEYDFSTYQKNNPDKKLLTMPKKSKYRMRAHCNPLSDISIDLYKLCY